MPSPTTDETRRCVRCGESRPTPEFPRDRTRQDGIGPQCRACNRARTRQQDTEKAAARQVVAAHGPMQALTVAREVIKFASERLRNAEKAHARAAGAAP